MVAHSTCEPEAVDQQSDNKFRFICKNKLRTDSSTGDRSEKDRTRCTGCCSKVHASELAFHCTTDSSKRIEDGKTQLEVVLAAA